MPQISYISSIIHTSILLLHPTFMEYPLSPEIEPLYQKQFVLGIDNISALILLLVDAFYFFIHCPDKNMPGV